MNLYLHYNQYEHVIHDDLGKNGPYSGSYEYRSTYENISIRLNNKGYDYRSYHTDEEIKKGDTVHVIYCIYSTGDTFGRHHSGGIEIMYVTKNEADANAVYKALNNYKRPARAWTSASNISTSTGEISMYIPWDGYFESLDELHYEIMIVED